MHMPLPASDNHGLLVIQVLFVGFAVWALARTFLRFRKRSITPVEWVLWSGFWTAVAVCVIKPDITQWFAHLLGVGRGADAVLYVGLVSLSYGFFRMYLRSRHTEQQITLLVRRLAIERARTEASRPGATRRSAT